MCPSPEPLSRSSKNNEFQNSVFQFKEVIMYTFYCKAQQRLRHKCHLTTATRTATEITQTGYSTILINQSNILRDACHKLFCVFGDLYASSTQGAEVTKSLSNVVPFHTMANRMYE